jgi:hypothetical protein
MGIAAGFLAGVIAAFVLVTGALGGVMFRLLSGEDDFDPDDEPADSYTLSPFTQEIPHG